MSEKPDPVADASPPEPAPGSPAGAGSSDSSHGAQTPAERPRVLEAPTAAWVKGGTTRLSYDLQLKRDYADAEARRDAEAARHASVANDPVHGRVYSRRLLNKNEHASVVLGLVHPKDKRILDWIECELIDHHGPGAGADEFILQLCCPQCVWKRGQHLQNAQIKIHQTHRMFYIDQRTRKERQPNKLLNFCAGDIWQNPEQPEQFIHIAAMITTNEWISCGGYGCTWRFKIDDSVVHSE
jgi:hypothetical protein